MPEKCLSGEFTDMSEAGSLSAESGQEEQMEDKNRIESAISKCSEDMQDLYTLRYRCNKTYQEIGELKRISAPAVVKRVQKLNEFIRKELESSDAD